jgi:type II secretory pathway pseudopilin PulG
MASAASASSSREAGFSLVEVVFAIFLLTAVAVGVAQLFAVGTLANFRAKTQTSATVLASQKMEQLRGLTWAFDSEGLPVSDVTSRLDTPEASGGGPGLNPSPGNSLTQDVPGYVDYLDIHGTYLGADPAGNAAYCRRWSIQPLPTNPNNTLVLQVRVLPVTQVAAADQTGRPALEEALIFSLKTWKAP